MLAEVIETGTLAMHPLYRKSGAMELQYHLLYIRFELVSLYTNILKNIEKKLARNCILLFRIGFNHIQLIHQYFTPQISHSLMFYPSKFFSHMVLKYCIADYFKGFLFLDILKKPSFSK